MTMSLPATRPDIPPAQIPWTALTMGVFMRCRRTMALCKVEVHRLMLSGRFFRSLRKALISPPKLNVLPSADMSRQRTVGFSDNWIAASQIEWQNGSSIGLPRVGSFKVNRAIPSAIATLKPENAVIPPPSVADQWRFPPSPLRGVARLSGRFVARPHKYNKHVYLMTLFPEAQCFLATTCPAGIKRFASTMPTCVPLRVQRILGERRSRPC